MASTQPRYSKEEFARRGDEIYERDLRSKLEPQCNGQFVAIDIETGKYETDTDDFSAVERLLEHNPDAQSWLVRVGDLTAYRTGRRPAQEAQ